MSKTQQILLGTVLNFNENPFHCDPEKAASVFPNGAILVENDRIVEIGSPSKLQNSAPNAQIVDYGDNLIMAGFVDAHVHYAQTPMIASWGKRLIDWLNTYTFPQEMKYGDIDYATQIANRYLDLVISNGTTTVASFCTIHTQSVDAIFEAAQTRNMCIIAGKTAMDRNAPDGLRDCAQSAYDESKALLNKWHGLGRCHYAITPRFSPTSTPEQLKAMGALWAEYPDCLMQTHLSEQTDEIEWVKSLFPKARDYLDTYEAFGLLGKNGLYGHAIYLEPREIEQLSQVGAAVVHCPTSNTFIGSGLFDMMGLQSTNMRIGLATDTGGGSSFSMLRTMAAAYEIGQLKGNAIHPSQLLWLATQGSAQALGMSHNIGNAKSGYMADLVVIDLASTPAIAQRSQVANSFWEQVFPTIMMGDDRAIMATYIAGNLQHEQQNE